MKKTVIAIVVAIPVFIAAIVIFNNQIAQHPHFGTIPPVSSGTPPSASGTTPPTPLPIPSEKGTVNGSVLLGPMCPVERIPPDPQCAPRPYETSIRIQPANPSAPYMTISSNASGTFSVSLDPGTYAFQPQGGNSMPPTCRATQVQVSAGQTQTANLDCDTGIR